MIVIYYLHILDYLKNDFFAIIQNYKKIKLNSIFNSITLMIILASLLIHLLIFFFRFKHCSFLCPMIQSIQSIGENPLLLQPYP